MTRYAVVVDGICDCSTTVEVEADNEREAQQLAVDQARDVPSEKWEHGEIRVVESSDLLRL